MKFPEITTDLILFAIFCFGYLIQLWYYLWIFIRLAFYRKKTAQENTPPTSIIICAKNEDSNLVNFLPIILSQDYPNYEVVVVNDGSFDNTGDVLKEFAKKHSHLKIVTIKEDDTHQHGKKFAVMVGIKGASNNDILFTDADCKPNGKDWLRNMMSEMKGETEIVLGYGGYEKTKGFLNKLIRFDTYYIALQYLSFCLAGRTYMGVGRNLAYKKTLFFKMKGFASHYFIESGDDDLFVNEAATKRNSKIEIAISSHTISKVKTSFMSWIWQKRRHISTASFYNFASKWRLLWLSVSQWMFFVGSVTLLIMEIQVYAVLGMILLRMILQILIFKKSMDRLGEKDLIYLSPLMEIVLMFFYPLLMLSNLFLKKSKWKRT